MNATLETVKPIANELTEPSHTPGPWIAQPINRAGDFRVFSTTDKEHTLYCEVSVGWGSNPRAIAAKNAALIASAPELLAALELALENLVYPGTHPAVIAAKSAIAKAKGEIYTPVF